MDGGGVVCMCGVCVRMCGHMWIGVCIRVLHKCGIWSGTRMRVDACEVVCVGSLRKKRRYTSLSLPCHLQ